MNINSNMKEEIRVNIKKYLPIIIALFVVVFWCCSAPVELQTESC